MSTSAVAYQLTDEHDLTRYGGTVHLRDGLSLDIGAALHEGDGTILTDDPLVIRTLDGRHDLRRTDIPEGALITSHQLDPAIGAQHQRDRSDVPQIAEQTVGMSGLEIMAAQARGELPVPTVPPADDDEHEQAAARPPDPNRPPAPPIPTAGQAPASAGAAGPPRQTQQPSGPDPAQPDPSAAATDTAKSDTGGKN